MIVNILSILLILVTQGAIGTESKGTSNISIIIPPKIIIQESEDSSEELIKSNLNESEYDIMVKIEDDTKILLYEPSSD